MVYGFRGVYIETEKDDNSQIIVPRIMLTCEEYYINIFLVTGIRVACRLF